MKRVLCLAAAAIVLPALIAGGGQEQRSKPSPAAATRTVAEPDWAEAEALATGYLRDLIRIDTANPPGNESLAAAYLKQVCDREGIANDRFAAVPERANFVARLRGSGAARPVLLMAHTDVVGVERALWSVDPFGGEVKDGFIYGRGALDDKGMVAANLAVLVLLKRAALPLSRDVVLLAEAGEEGDSDKVGIGWMVANHYDAIDAEFAMNEEGRVMQDASGQIRYIGVQTTEKVAVNMRLVASGHSAHGSIPRPDNAVVHLARAVAAAGALELPVKLVPTTQRFFDGLAQSQPASEALLYRAVLDPARAGEAARGIAALNLTYSSMLRTSISPTMIAGGFRTNVIPGSATATLNVRLVPGDTIDNVVSVLTRAIADPAVRVDVERGERPEPPASSFDSELFRAVERAAAVMSPNVPVLPYMSTGATDSAQLRAKGVQALGVIPLPYTEEDRGRFHGNDERLAVKSLGYGVQMLWRVATDLAAARPRAALRDPSVPAGHDRDVR